MGKSARNANSVNRLDALTVATVAEAKALDVPVGTVVETQGGLTASDGGSKKYVVVASGSGSNEVLFPTMNNGNQLRLLSGNLIIDLTVNIPTDYATFQDAIVDLKARMNFAPSVSADLKAEAGHQPSSGIAFSLGDYSNFKISSVDSLLQLSSLSSGRFLDVENCVAPLLNCIVDGAGSWERSYDITNGRGYVNSGCGGQNFTGRVLYANGAIITAGDTVWTDSEAIFCTNGSSVNLAGSNVSDMSSSGVTFSEGATGSLVGANISSCPIGIQVKDACVVDSEFVTIDGTTSEAVRVDNAVITLDRAYLINCMGDGINQISGNTNAPSATITANNTNKVAIRARQGSLSVAKGTIEGFANGIISDSTASVTSHDANITCGTEKGNGVYANTLGSVNVEGAKVTGFSIGQDLRVLIGGTICAFGAETTSSQTSGNFPDVSDTEANGAGGFNSILSNGKGIIWA